MERGPKDLDRSDSSEMATGVTQCKSKIPRPIEPKGRGRPALEKRGVARNSNPNQGVNKSHSDTTLYAPAVAIADQVPKSPLQTVAGLSPNLARKLVNKERENINDSMVLDYIKRIRLSDFTGENNRATVRSEVVRPTGSQERRTEEVTDPLEQARLDAQTNVIAAERYKASLAPTGKNPWQIGSNNPDMAPQRNLVYYDPDDDFFHATCHVDTTIRDRIRRGEFVELEKLLLKKGRNKSTEDQKLEIFNRDGKAYLAPSTDKDSKITGIQRWDQAFRVYATIYSEANPSRAAEIWQYVDVIHRAARAFNWENVANYDYVFRQLMAENPARKWSKTYTQMWNLNLCEPTVRMSNNNVNQTGGRKPRGEIGLCWRFNKDKCKYGDSCNFEHRCSYCFKTGHPASRCYKKKGSAGGSDRRDKKDKDKNETR